jgi:hypothetical protein
MAPEVRKTLCCRLPRLMTWYRAPPYWIRKRRAIPLVVQSDAPRATRPIPNLRRHARSPRRCGRSVALLPVEVCINN